MWACLAVCITITCLHFDFVRLGGAEALRPTLVIAAPLALAFFRLSGRAATLSITARAGKLCAALVLILLANHLLGKDKYFTSLDSSAYSNLDFFSLAGMLLFFSFGFAAGVREELDLTARATCLVSAVIQAGALLLLPNAMEHQGTMRQMGLLTDPNIVVVYFLPSYAYSLGAYAHRRFRWCIYAALPVILLALLATLSKMAALLIPTLLLTVLTCVAARRLRRHALGILAGCGLIVIGLLGWRASGIGIEVSSSLPIPSFIGDRLNDLTHRFSASAHKDNVIEEKLFWWETLAETNWLSAEPLLGPGWSNPQNPHNTFLDMYFMGGIPGALVCIAVFLYPLVQLGRHAANRGPGLSDSRFVASVVSLVALTLILCALSLPTNKLIWLLLGLNCGYAHRHSRRGWSIRTEIKPHACMRPGLLTATHTAAPNSTASRLC